MEALAVVLVIALSVWLTVSWRGRYWHNRIARWAEGEGLQLLDTRAAKAREGPAQTASADHQSVFRVRVCERDGTVKQVWLTFGRRLDARSAPDELIEVRWDESRSGV